MPTPTITITGSYISIDGVNIPPLSGGVITATLGGYGNSIPAVGTVSILASASITTTISNSGSFTLGPFFGNDVITPAGTSYTITIPTATGMYEAQYYLTGSGSFVLANLSPIGGVAPAVPSGVSVLPVPFTPVAGQFLTGMNSAGSFSSASTNSLNDRFIAGSPSYATIAAARTAAVANTVEIPSSYAGTDTIADGNNPVIDFRHNAIATSHYFIGAYPMTNAPGGLDVALVANGAGDLHLSHNTQVNPATTTAVTLNIGANTNFLVGSTANFGTGGSAPLIIGRDTANEETVSSGSWSIVDGTHMTVTCAKTHGPGTTDIEQLGVTALDPGIVIQLAAHKPSQFSATSFPPTRWNDSNGSPFLIMPGQAGATFPYGQILVASNTAISGFVSGLGSAYLTAGDVNFRNASASKVVNFNNSANTLAVLKISDTTVQFGAALVDATAGGTPAASGALRFRNAGSIRWNNAGGTADLDFGPNAADGLAFNTAAVNGRIPYCMGTVDLTAQSAAVGPTTIRAVAANQAGMYRISWAAVVTQAATTSSTLGGANTGFQVTYTDNDTGAAVTTPLAAAPGAGTNTAYSQTNSQNTVGAQASGVVVVNAKASTNIQYSFGYTSVGGTVMQYALHVRIEPI